MKKVLLTLMTTGCFIFMLGQVGINTAKPRGIFHVDGKNDNNDDDILSEEQKANDFVVTQEGNIGIGVELPSVKLEIKTKGTSDSPESAIKIVDGSQGKGKVMTSDEEGEMTWQFPVAYRVEGTLGEGVDLPLNRTLTSFEQTGCSITLPPGKWQVTVSMLLVGNAGNNGGFPANKWVWVKTTFSEYEQGETFNISSDIKGNKYISGLFEGPVTIGQKFTMLAGSVIIHNQSTSSKTYYYVAGQMLRDQEGGSVLDDSVIFSDFGDSNSAENNISAISLM